MRKTGGECEGLMEPIIRNEESNEKNLRIIM